jgi:hypothetical protein
MAQACFPSAREDEETADFGPQNETYKWFLFVLFCFVFVFVLFCSFICLKFYLLFNFVFVFLF